MKKMFLIFTILILFGCSLQNELSESELTNSKLMELAKDHNLYYLQEWEYLTDPYEIIGWIKNHVVYKAEPYREDYWQDPEETLLLGTGDCEDFVILFMNIYYISTGIKTDMALVDMYEFFRDIGEGGDANHALVLLENNRTIDPQTGIYWNFSIKYIMYFDDIFLY